MEPRLDRRVDHAEPRQKALDRRCHRNSVRSFLREPDRPGRCACEQSAEDRVPTGHCVGRNRLLRGREAEKRRAASEQPDLEFIDRRDRCGGRRMSSVGALANRGRPAFVPQPRSARRPEPERSSVGPTRPHRRRDGPASSSTSVRERAASTSFVGDSLRGGHRVLVEQQRLHRSCWRALWSRQPRQGRRGSPSRAQSARPAPREIVQRSSPR